jgi:hypothetical protein
MSTTAGMGSGEYVEINPVAITSVILAGLSLLGIAFMPFLLLGMLGIASGLLALFKIRRSNGTQGGKLIAVVGIALSLLISGGEGTRQWVIHSRNQADGNTIRGNVQQLGDYLAKRDYAKARSMFGRPFLDKIPQEAFDETFKSICGIKDYGDFQGLDANGAFGFSTLGDGTRMGSTMIQAKFSNKTLDFAPVEAIMDEQGRWIIYNIPDVFPSVPKLQ